MTQDDMTTDGDFEPWYLLADVWQAFVYSDLVGYVLTTASEHFEHQPKRLFLFVMQFLEICRYTCRNAHEMMCVFDDSPVVPTMAALKVFLVAQENRVHFYDNDGEDLWDEDQEWVVDWGVADWSKDSEYVTKKAIWEREVEPLFRQIKPVTVNRSLHVISDEDL